MDQTSIHGVVGPLRLQLMPLVDKVLAMPGVKEKIGPVVEQIMGSVKRLAGV